MINKFTSINTVEEIASVVLENWNNNDLESFSDTDINLLKKYFLDINLLSLAKKMSPLDSFTYLQFRLNFSRLILSQISDKDNVIYLKLKFAVWHYSVERKIRNFLIKTIGNETIQKKLNHLLLSLKSLSNFDKSISRRDLSSKFMILSDLTSQLGHYMFSLISIKKSVNNDPEFIDAALFLGKAHLELGNALSKKSNKNNTNRKGHGELQYNFDKSKTILKNTLNKIKDESSKSYVKNLISSVDSVLNEISDQRRGGQNTIAQIAVEEFISKNLEKVEDLIISGFSKSSSNFKFATNIVEEEEIRKKKQQVIESKPKVDKIEKKLQDNNTLTIVSNPDNNSGETIVKKGGKLFDVYNNANKIVPKEDGTKPKKHGTIRSDNVGYKLKLENILKQKIDEKNSRKTD